MSKNLGATKELRNQDSGATNTGDIENKSEAKRKGEKSPRSGQARMQRSDPERRESTVNRLLCNNPYVLLPSLHPFRPTPLRSGTLPDSGVRISYSCWLQHLPGLYKQQDVAVG